MISRETFAVEQIEILERPSSTIGGRGTTGGSVNSVSKRPGFTDFAKVETGMGNEVTKRLTFDVNSVVSPKLALRFNGLVQDGEVAGRDEVFDDRYGAAWPLPNSLDIAPKIWIVSEPEPKVVTRKTPSSAGR